jgi:TetR/AcrR family transcriptional repressor of lmrAB and yxaGH operons
MGSKERMIETMSRLLWSQGLRATGMNQIVKESGAQRGSIYFHFPGGKDQLAAEALRAAGATMTNNIRGALEERDVCTAIRKFALSYAKEMRDSDFHHGSPIATVALEAASTSPTIREVCANVFAEWEALLTARLLRDGVIPREAGKLAVVILSSIEGAMILSRARKSTKPIEHVADALVSAVGTARRSRRR